MSQANKSKLVIKQGILSQPQGRLKLPGFQVDKNGVIKKNRYGIDS